MAMPTLEVEKTSSNRASLSRSSLSAFSRARISASVSASCSSDRRRRVASANPFASALNTSTSRLGSASRPVTPDSFGICAPSILMDESTQSGLVNPKSTNRSATAVTASSSNGSACRASARSSSALISSLSTSSRARAM
jgi:hypothetical protein